MLENANRAPTHKFTGTVAVYCLFRRRPQKLGAIQGIIVRKEIKSREARSMNRSIPTCRTKPLESSHIIPCLHERDEKKSVPEMEELGSQPSWQFKTCISRHPANKVGAYLSTGSRPLQGCKWGFWPGAEDKIIGFFHVGCPNELTTWADAIPFACQSGLIRKITSINHVWKQAQIPFPFVLDELDSLNPRTRPMFSWWEFMGRKIVLALRKRANVHRW